MERLRKDKERIAELLSVGVKPGTVLSVQVRETRGLTSYVGPVEKIDAESLTLVKGKYYLRKSIPVSLEDSSLIRFYGSEIKDYQVLSPLLAAAVPRFKRKY